MRSFNVKNNILNSELEIIESKILILKELVQKYKDFNTTLYNKYKAELDDYKKKYPELLI